MGGFDSRAIASYTAHRFRCRIGEGKARETYIPTKQSCPQAAARFSLTLSIRRGTPGACSQAVQGAKAPIRLITWAKGAIRSPGLSKRPHAGSFASSVGQSFSRPRQAAGAGLCPGSCCRFQKGRVRAHRLVAKRGLALRLRVVSAMPFCEIEPSAGFEKHRDCCYPRRQRLFTTMCLSPGLRY